MAATSVRVTPYGERALLVRLPLLPDRRPAGADPELVRAWAAAIWEASSRGALGGVLDVVPAAASVLIRVDSVAARVAAAPVVATLRPRPPVESIATEEISLTVRYDGPDLSAVAELTGMDAAEVVRRHTSSPWRVGFSGFAPGFAYLVGGDPALAVPRRDTPRPRVAPGSVALASGYCAVYPRQSPGGWQLIGTCAATLWDPAASPPALLHPGRLVRFVAESDPR